MSSLTTSKGFDTLHTGYPMRVYYIASRANVQGI